MSFDMSDGTTYQRPTKASKYAQFYQENPVVMLIMPPINDSLNVDAKDYFYSTLAVPVAEAGFYVLPPYLTLEVLQRESAYDSELFIDKDLSKFKEVFGADVAVFTKIHTWEKSMLDYSVSVKIEYIFKSTETNEVLYRKTATMVRDTSQSIETDDDILSAVLSIVVSSVSTVLVDYVDLAQNCNEYALSNLPRGKYHKRYGQDLNDSPTADEITLE